MDIREEDCEVVTRFETAQNRVGWRTSRAVTWEQTGVGKLREAFLQLLLAQNVDRAKVCNIKKNAKHAKGRGIGGGGDTCTVCIKSALDLRGRK